MTERPAFAMPPLPAQWRDDAGRSIEFGRRWGMGGPPEDAYSVVTHPERYAPLHEVADALEAHLLEAYDCVAEEDAPAEHELRAVRLVPAGGAEGIRIAWTDFPGVRAALGDELDAAAPLCGCDACDEPLEDAAWQLCDRVLAAAHGGGWPLRAG